MSIRELIGECVAGGDLALLTLRLPGSPLMRNVFVTPQVNSFLNEATKSASAALLKRASDTWLMLERFSAGVRVSVRMDPEADRPTAMLARNSPTEKGIWEFRIRDPKPHVRVFGGFAERDTFIALDYRAKPIDYDDAVQNAMEMWRALFGDLGPLTGDDLDAYLSDRYHLA